MLLAVDNGNTNVKFALVDEAGEIVQRWRIATDARRTADEYAVWLDQLLQMLFRVRCTIFRFSAKNISALMRLLPGANRSAGV